MFPPVLPPIPCPERSDPDGVLVEGGVVVEGGVESAELLPVDWPVPELPEPFPLVLVADLPLDPELEEALLELLEEEDEELLPLLEYHPELPIWFTVSV